MLHDVSKFAPLKYVLKTRRYQLIIILSGTIYAIAYMFAVGIISYYPGFGALKISVPVVNANSLGIMIIPFSYVFVFIFYYALAFLIVSSFLVGLNMALVFYSRKVKAKSCDISSNKRRRFTNINISSRVIAGIIPAFFTSFACCGGGFLALVIGSTAFSSLAIYSKYMASLTIAVLAAGAWLMSLKIRSNSISYRRCDDK